MLQHMVTLILAAMYNSLSYLLTYESDIHQLMHTNFSVQLFRKTQVQIAENNTSSDLVNLLSSSRQFQKVTIYALMICLQTTFQ